MVSSFRGALLWGAEDFLLIKCPIGLLISLIFYEVFVSETEVGLGADDDVIEEFIPE